MKKLILATFIALTSVNASADVFFFIIEKVKKSPKVTVSKIVRGKTTVRHFVDLMNKEFSFCGVPRKIRFPNPEMVMRCWTYDKKKLMGPNTITHDIIFGKNLKMVKGMLKAAGGSRK